MRRLLMDFKVSPRKDLYDLSNRMASEILSERGSTLTLLVNRWLICEGVFPTDMC